LYIIYYTLTYTILQHITLYYLIFFPEQRLAERVLVVVKKS